ncbi:MAG: hypothetical protein U5N58_03565 [Actinomycetota bacterium]|nr:hypothetical protein [Actinomycetota bacterium]
MWTTAVIPFKSGKVNACWGCYGCRDATDIGREEGLIGIPAGVFSQIVKNLVALETKPIKNARKKMAFSTIKKHLE